VRAARRRDGEHREADRRRLHRACPPPLDDPPPAPPTASDENYLYLWNETAEATNTGTRKP